MPARSFCTNRPRYEHTSWLEIINYKFRITGEYRVSGFRGWKWGFRIPAGIWCLAAVVFFNSYSSVLISSLTTPTIKRYPSSSIEVVNEGSLAYLVVRNGMGQEMIMVSQINWVKFEQISKNWNFQSATSGSLKKMGDVFRKHPEYLVRNREEAYNFVVSGCCAFSDVSMEKHWWELKLRNMMIFLKSCCRL